MPSRHPRRHAPGNGGHRPAQVARELGGDQAAARIRRLDDERHACQPGHDAVAGREAPALRGGPRRQLGHHEAALGHLLVQAPVPAGIGPLRTARQNGQRRASPVEAAAVRCGIDAQREPAHDRDPGRAETASERVRDLGPVWRGPPGPDDRHRGRAPARREQLRTADAEEGRRRVRKLEQLPRVPAVRAGRPRTPPPRRAPPARRLRRNARGARAPAPCRGPRRPRSSPRRAARAAPARARPSRAAL